MTAEEYCRDKACPAGSNLYYSLLYQKTGNHRALRALFAFYYQLQEIVADNKDPGISRIKLQWWREEIERVFMQQARHPVGKELALLLEQQSLDKQFFSDCIDYSEAQIGGLSVQAVDDWLSTFGAASGSLWASAATACQPVHADSVALVRQAGQCFAVIELIQNLQQTLRAGLCLLPEKEMEVHQVTFSLMQTEPEHPNIKSLFITLVEGLEDKLKHCHGILLKNDRHSLLFCLVNLKIMLVLCKKIRHQQESPLLHSPTLTPIRKLWIAWRTK